MKDVKAIPAIPEELKLFGKGQSRTMRAFIAQCAAADDDDRALCRLKGIADMLGQLAKQAKISAKEFRLIGQVGFWPDGKDLRALFPDGLLDAGVDQRRLTARIGPDEQNDISILNIGNARVEIHRSQAGGVIGKARLTAFEHGAAQQLHKLARSKHGFAIDLIARNGRDRFSGLRRCISNSLQRVGPIQGNQLAILAHIGTIQTTLGQPVHRMAGFVAGPLLIHIFIDARKGAQHLPPTAVEADIGANGVHHINGRRLLQLPRARNKGIGLGRQRADRAQVNHIARKLARHRMLKIAGDLHILAAINRADFLNTRHFFGKTDAACALNAARHHRFDDGAHILLGDGTLILIIARPAPAIGH